MTTPIVLVLSPGETYFAWNIFHALKDADYAPQKAKTVADFEKAGNSLETILFVVGEQPTDVDVNRLEKEKIRREFFRYILCDEKDPSLQPEDKFFVQDSPIGDRAISQSCYCLSKDPDHFIKLIKEGW